jgi:hypothetical protein
MSAGCPKANVGLLLTVLDELGEEWLVGEVTVVLLEELLRGERVGTVAYVKWALDAPWKETRA